MTRPRSTARRAPQTMIRAVALSGVLAVSGLAAVTASASGSRLAGEQVAHVSLAYACRFPSGPRQVQVAVTAAFPGAATVGRPVGSADVQLTVALPQAALANLGSVRPTAISAAIRLAVTATGGTAATSVVWPGATRQPVPVPARGALVLQVPGTGLPVIPDAPGKVTLTASSLSIMLSAAGAGGPQPSTARIPAASGTAVQATPAARATSSPPAASRPLQVACTLGAGQAATLAALPVSGNAVRKAAKTKKPNCPAQPKGGLKLNPKFPPPKPPPGSTISHPTPLKGCAYIVGYSDVRKLNGAALVGPGITALALNIRVVSNANPPYIEIDSAGQLDFQPCPTCKVVHGLPPAHTTFLGFGFVPVSATLQLTEIGTTNVFSVGNSSSLSKNTIWSDVVLRVYDVRVNGVPLDVGPHCQSARPVLLKLVGKPSTKPPYSLLSGGPLLGEITIPPFTGCGVGENLNPLFTASISGPGNFTLLTQGPICALAGPGCPPPIPKPLRKVRD